MIRIISKRRRNSDDSIKISSIDGNFTPSIPKNVYLIIQKCNFSNIFVWSSKIAFTLIHLILCGACLKLKYFSSKVQKCKNFSSTLAKNCSFEVEMWKVEIKISPFLSARLPCSLIFMEG